MTNRYRIINLDIVLTVFRLLTDFVCLYTYEFWLSLWKIVGSSVILLLPLFKGCHTTDSIYFGLQKFKSKKKHSAMMFVSFNSNMMDVTSQSGTTYTPAGTTYTPGVCQYGSCCSMCDFLCSVVWTIDW
jgi:hypothetical protein